MTTIARSIIADALRESGILALGETVSAESEAEALTRLNVIIRSLLGNEAGEELLPVSFGTYNLSNSFGKAKDQSSIILSTYLPSNTRLYVNKNTVQTIFLDPNPADGSRVSIIDSAGNFATYNLIVDGNGRSIEGASTSTLATNGQTKEWFYRADTGNWVLISDLTEESVLPFPSEFDDLIVTMLAMRLNPRYGQTIPPESLEALRRSRGQFRSRYRQNHPISSELALLRLNSDRNKYSYQDEFEKGTRWNY